MASLQFVSRWWMGFSVLAQDFRAARVDLMHKAREAAGSMLGPRRAAMGSQHSCTTSDILKMKPRIVQTKKGGNMGQTWIL